jgi:long-chain acyl-CoA synthetase
MAAPGEHNLARLAEGAFQRRGDYPSLLFEGVWHRSGELYERSCRMATGLAELGVAAGDRVVVTMANCPEVGITYQALWRAGAVVTPATFLLSADELGQLIADSGATAVVTTPELLAKVLGVVSGAGSVRAVITVGEPASGALALSELEQSEPSAIVERGDEDLAALLYTGGTTGRAKGVMLSHANLYYSGAAAQQASHVPGVNRSLVTLPLSHSYGLLVTIGGMHSPEIGIAVLLRWFDPVAFLELIQEHRLEQSAVVPSMLQILLSQPLEQYDLSSLRFLTSGGAPLAWELAEEFSRRVRTVSVRQGYGLTETAALVSTNPAGAERPGSVGLPVPGTEVKIVDPEGKEVPPGEAGEICARSPAVMRGYWHAPEATSQALRDGWLQTGDIGYRDADGYLFIVDRKKDLIIRGGFNVYPRDVEDALLEHPEIELAGVVGRPDNDRGEEVVAFVSLRSGSRTGPDELVGWARERIGGYKYPREVHIVDAVPLTPVGKIDRKALRSSLAAGSGAPRAGKT